MRPALFFALKRGYDRYRIIAVTTEKPRNWHGRELPDNTATHGTFRDLIGRFDTEAAARAKVDQVARIMAHHQPLIDAAQKASMQAYTDQQEAIAAELGVTRV